MLKLNARNCEVKEVPKAIYKKFVDKNHTQRYANAEYIYGLFYNNELVQIMSFGAPRFNNNYQWEIIRECTKQKCLVRGGTSKLWTYFLSRHSCHSCICYHYPTNKTYTEHLTKYCNFVTIKKVKPEKKIYFEGEWNGKHKRIDKSILERHGVDRLLKTEQGKDRSNEQILLDLGFKRIEEDGYSPQVDIYYPFSVVYRIDDLMDGKFYIGMCEVQNTWNKGYLGSGHQWTAHLNKHPNKSLHKHRKNLNAHLYQRTIIKSNFKTPKETRKFEKKVIEQYFDDSNNCNTEIRTQGSPYIVKSACPECGGKSGNHKKSCSKYKAPNACPECGSAYKHKEWCSHASPANRCPECGGNNKHKKTCSHYKESKKICPECKGKAGKHKQFCSRYKAPKICSECGSKGGSHKKGCSKRKIVKCSECGVVGGNHKKSCSKYKIPSGTCSYCGTPKGGYHKKDCPNHPGYELCPECGGKLPNHKKSCSKFHKKICSECGVVGGNHLKTCSYYKAPEPCPECGSLAHRHKKGCSFAKNKDKY